MLTSHDSGFLHCSLHNRPSVIFSGCAAASERARERERAARGKPEPGVINGDQMPRVISICELPQRLPIVVQSL